MPTTIQERCKIASDIAGGILWKGPAWGETTCPSGHDCRIYIDDNPRPKFFCFHTGCQKQDSQLQEWNRQLRERCGDLIKRPLMPEEKEERDWFRRLHDLRNNVERYILPAMIKQPPVPLSHWLQISPFAVTDMDGQQQFKAYVTGLFQDAPILSMTPVVWIGERYESGSPEFARNFKTTAEWLRVNYHPGSQICLSQFRAAGTNGQPICQRQKQNVLNRDYIVLESDSISKEQFGVLIKFMQESLMLRAITDTGNKSLHAVFDRPAPPAPRYGKGCPEDLQVQALKAHSEDLHTQDEQWTRRAIEANLAWVEAYKRLHRLREADKKRLMRAEEELFWQLRGLGCDPNMWSMVGTTRLPGCPRYDDDGAVIGQQKLLYLNPKYEVVYE